MPATRTWRRSIAVAVALCAVAAALFAQRRFGGRFVPMEIPPNSRYDGRFTFA
jgi:hypothetical protein